MTSLKLITPISIAPTPPVIDQVVIWNYDVNLDRREVLIEFRSYINKIQVGNNAQQTILFDQVQTLLGKAATAGLSIMDLYQLLKSSLKIVGGTVS